MIDNLDMNTLVYDGGTIKSLGGNRIGGHLVLFTTKNDPDTTGDYFTDSTEFFVSDGDSRPGFYNHGFDLKLNNMKIGDGVLSKRDTGIWLEAQLKERDEYVDAIMEMVRQGACGLSSGALSHLVRREAKNKAGTLNHVTHWAIGEWSITPVPAEPRTLAMPIKMWAESLPKQPPDDVPVTIEEERSPAAPETKAAVSISTVRELEQLLRDAGVSRKQATAWALHGYNSLRDAGEHEPITPAPEPPAATIDEATRQARESAFRFLAHRTEGLRLASL